MSSTEKGATTYEIKHRYVPLAVIGLQFYLEAPSDNYIILCETMPGHSSEYNVAKHMMEQRTSPRKPQCCLDAELIACFPQVPGTGAGKL